MRDLLLILILLLYFFRPMLGPVVLATIVAMTLYPVYQRRPGYLTAALLTLGATALIIFIAYHFSVYLYDQALYIVNIFNRLSPEVQLQLINFSSQVPIYNFALSLVNSLPSMAIKILMTVIATFYFLLDGHRIKNAARNLFPPEKADAMIEEASYNLRSIILGVFVSMFAYILIGTLVLVLTATPRALLYAVVAGLFGPIPIVAGWMVYGYVIAQKVMAGQYWGVVAVVIFLTLWQVIGDPYFRIKYRGRIHPLILLLSMVSGIALFGFSGLVVGPVLVSLAYTWIKVEHSG
ncbi:MAG TPA: AI-2E family transporter [archaeon]|nr:AI-2E family transporter [archaeon]